MIFTQIYRFLCGYVRFRASGDRPEEILNAFSRSGADIWDMHRSDSGIEASVKLHNYKNIRKIRGKMARTRVIKRVGLPFVIYRYRHRTGLAAGFAIFLLALFVLPNFIWNIEIVGNQKTSDEAITAALYELGVREGVPRKSINSGEIRAKLPLKVDGISWLAVNVEGVKATVELRESVEVETTEKQPCNLVAKRDGIITQTRVINGTLVAKPGMSVAKGDLLVSGVVEYKNMTSAFKAAEGMVAAKTERTFRVFVPFENTATVKTGESRTRTVASFLGVDIPLFIGNVQGDYIKEDNVYTYKKNGMYIPVKFYTSTFHKTKTKSYVITTDEAIKIAEDKIEEYISADEGIIDIISSNDNLTVTDEGVLLIRNAVTEENIAFEEPLLFSDEQLTEEN